MSVTSASPDATAQTAGPDGEAGDERALTVANLRYSYPPPRRGDRIVRPALDGVSFDVTVGEMFGLLGPNGSGKSTLFGLTTTSLPLRDTGCLRVFGRDPAENPAAVRPLIGVVFQRPSLDGQLTCRENLLHHGHLYGLRGPTLAEKVDTLLERFCLADRRDEPVYRLSGGLARRVEIAKAMLPSPRMLLLDEPSTGLDPGARRDLSHQLHALRDADGVTIVLTTHDMDEAEHCDRVAILSRGRLLAVDAPDALRRTVGGEVVTLEPADSTPAGLDALLQRLRETLGPFDDSSHPTIDRHAIRIEVTDGPAFITRAAAALGPTLRRVSLGRPTLEDVFLHLTGRSLAADEGAETTISPYLNAGQATSRN